MRDLFYSKDEIYLDITHGFRYMPILNLFMLETLKALHPKLFEVKAILYGVFAGDESEIVDFKAFLDLLDWIKAINAFKYCGHAYDLASLLEREEKKVSNILKQFSDNFLLGNMQALWGFMKDIEKKLSSLNTSQNKIIHILSIEFEQLAKRFDKQYQSDFQYELAKWLFEGKNYALSYIALYEAIITKSCELDGSEDCLEYDIMEKAKRSIGDDKYGN